MEVLSFFSSSRNLVDYFGVFMDSYPKLLPGLRDEDTAYFVNPKTDRNEIYFHFVQDDVEHEFSYNYTEAEQSYIKDFFVGQKFFLFDIQFRDEKFLKGLLRDFKDYLKRNWAGDIGKKILIVHPHKGILRLDETEAP